MESAFHQRLRAKTEASLLQRTASLPVTQQRDKFVAIFRDNQIMIVSSETGSGKSTVLPRFVLVEQLAAGKQIAVTQPRRLAAREVAGHVAREMDVELGREVGYRVRGDNMASETTRISYMTDGLLFAESFNDKLFQKYSTIIIDEAHERTESTDLLLPLLKRATESREDLSIIIMSASIDIAKFASYFRDAPVLEIEGRQFPVEILYLEQATPAVVNSLCKVVLNVHRNEPAGDVLVFLAGVEEIGYLCTALSLEIPEGAEFLPLYAGLRKEQQERAISGPISGRRKFILTTNIAETSITVPGIVYVIDVGYFKQMSYNHRGGSNMLRKIPISRAAATQRAGRAGRTRAGKVFRLYTKSCFESVMQATPCPSILRTNFSASLLRLLHAGLGNPFTADLMDRPNREAIFAALTELHDLNLIRDDCAVTAHGLRAASLPVAPIWYRALDVAQNMNCLPEMITMAAVASNQESIYKRVPESAYGATYVARDAFADPQSDHITQLNVVYAYMLAKENQARNLDTWCDEFLLNRQAIEEVIETRAHLGETVLGMRANFTITPLQSDTYRLNLRKALALGLFRHTAIREPGQETFRTIHSNQAALVLHDSQLRTDLNVDWLVYSDLNAVGRQQFDTVTAINPEWIMGHDYFQVQRMPKSGKDGLGDQPVMKHLAEELDKVRAKKAQREKAAGGSLSP